MAVLAIALSLLALLFLFSIFKIVQISSESDDYDYHIEQTKIKAKTMVEGTYSDFMLMFQSTKWVGISKGFFANVLNGDQCSYSTIKFRNIHMIIKTKEDYIKIQKFLLDESSKYVDINKKDEPNQDVTIITNSSYWTTLLNTEKENTN